MKKIIILIPVYNDINRIEECINSLASQSSSPAFEVIIIDNGSTDGTYELLQKLQPIQQQMQWHKMFLYQV